MTITMNRNKIISVILIIVLALSMVLCSYIQADAFAPVIVVGGAAVLSALLVTAGYSYLTTGDVTKCWDNMSQGLRDDLTAIGQHCTQSSTEFAFAKAVISSAVYQKFLEWFDAEAYDGLLPDGMNQLMINPVGFISTLPLQARWETECTAKAQSMGTFWMIDEYYGYNWSGYIYSSDSPIYFTYDTNATAFKIWSVSPISQCLYTKVWSDPDGCYIPSFGTIQHPANGTCTIDNTNSSHLYYNSATTIWVQETSDPNSDVMGYFGPHTVPYTYNDNYSPDVNPVPADSDGNVNITMPYTDAPDTNVEIPADNSIDDPVSLETVINGYGSIDGFFDAGGKITLSDGTVLSGETGENDLSRSTGSVLPNTGTGTVEGDVSGIKSLVNKLVGVVTGIGTAISDWADVGDFSLNFDALKVNFMDKFPFCIPFDFSHLVSAFSASPDDFSFKIDLDTTYFQIHHAVDLSPFQMPILFFRYCVVAWFTFILISRTRDMIKW